MDRSIFARPQGKQLHSGLWRPEGPSQIYPFAGRLSFDSTHDLSEIYVVCSGTLVDPSVRAPPPARRTFHGSRCWPGRSAARQQISSRIARSLLRSGSTGLKQLGRHIVGRLLIFRIGPPRGCHNWIALTISHTPLYNPMLCSRIGAAHTKTLADLSILTV